jgi:hypothetical protein
LRQPAPPGTPIDENRRSQWLERFQGYRTPVGPPELDAWIGLFDARHHDLAARVLDAVEYLTPHEMEDAFRTILSTLPGWSHDAVHRQGKWRFVAFGAPGGSGDRMLHVFRIANGLDWPQFEELFIHKSELLLQDLGPEDTVVFLDDFAGSGDQVCNAWSATLAELLPTDPKAYLVLVGASVSAIDRIRSTTGLQPEAHRTFAGADNVFSEECAHFSADDRSILLTYCQRADGKQPRGYGNCGLLVVLAHRCPNNSLPILHARNKRFVGLFPRN